jgi:hypothetical protein
MKDVDTNRTLERHFRGTLSVSSEQAARENGVPDSLDLVAMARAGLNYLRGNPEPVRRHECKFSLGPLGIPCHYPELVRPNQYGYDPISLGDTDSRMEWQYRHMRTIAGEPDACAIERAVRERVLGYLRDDGFSWINPSAYTGRPEKGHYVGTWTTAKALVTLTDLYRYDGDGTARRRAREVFVALRSLAQWDGDRAWYMGIAPWRDGEWLLANWCETHGRNYPFIIEPLIHYGEGCDDPEALALAHAFAEGFLAGSQPDMGSQRVDPETGSYTGHVHLHTHGIWGVAHLGAITGDKRYLDWARRAYDFTVGHGTDHGWYPEFIPQQEYRTEICVVGDMISLGVWLAQGISPSYWDHVERTVRNTLARSQFFLTDAFVEFFRRIHKDHPSMEVEQALRELRRLEGGFVAQASFDDWVSYPDNPALGTAGLNSNGIQMMGCCPPEGLRGVWEAWRWAVQDEGGEVRVNLALSREHPSARVVAWKPEDGGYEVIPMKPGCFLLRPPAWASRDGVVLSRNGAKVPVEWGGPEDAYVLCSEVDTGEALRLSWPVPHFSQTFTPSSVEGRDERVSFEWVGPQVVGVTPKGQHLPMFQSRKENIL